MDEAHRFAAHAFVPYSRHPSAAVVLLDDGTMVPGVRVESASFSLTIPAVLNALTTATAAGRRDFAAIVLTDAAGPSEIALLGDLGFSHTSEHVLRRPGVEVLPSPGPLLDPWHPGPVPADEASGILLAREVAGRAHVPESRFPVGCVIVAANGKIIPGVNVEHPDWTRILCAERNALGTAITYAAGEIERMYLTCLEDPTGTPCGACRQLMAEFAPGSEVIIDRGSGTPERTTPNTLLPGSFTGASIHRQDAPI
jgi:cytidine deaminase